MTATIDLTPRSRHDARARAKRVRAWIATGGLYAGALAVAVLLLRSEFSSESAAIEAKIQQIRQQNLEQSTQRADLINARAELQRSMAASTAIRSQPDWSVPLTVIANAFIGDGVFDSIQIEPVFDAPAAQIQRRDPNAPDQIEQPIGFVIRIEGYCIDDQSLTALIRTLEEAGLFRAVKWVESRREVYHGTDMVRFRVDCTVGGSRS